MNSSVLRHAWIHLIGPGQDAAFQVVDPPETRLPQQLDSARAPLTGTAMDDDLFSGVQLIHALWHIAKRNEHRTRNPADVELVRFAHVDKPERPAFIHHALELDRSNLGHPGGLLGFGSADSAELLVVAQPVDRRMRSAHRAIRVLTQLQLAEAKM